MGGTELSVNNLAYRLVETMIRREFELGLKVLKLTNGTIVIDGGIEASGGFEGGLDFARVCLGGLGRVETSSFLLKGRSVPAVMVYSDHPVIACMASQYAGWKIEEKGYFAMASGPARALAGKEEIFSKIEYRDRSERATVVLETGELPTVEIAEYIARFSGVSSENLFILVAPTDCLTGSVQISARIVETGIHKLDQLGFDLANIKSGWGICPIAPPASGTVEAIGRTNDAVLYGGTAAYTVCARDDEIEALIERVPSKSSKDYGTSFGELFRKYGNFYGIDPLLFSPAVVQINNLNTGSVFESGEINEDILYKSFYSMGGS